MKLLPLAVCLFTATLMAQPPFPRSEAAQAPTMDALKLALGLSNDQIAQLRQLRIDQLKAAKSILDQIRPLEKSLQDTLKAGGADPSSLGQKLIQIEALKTQLRGGSDRCKSQALAVLTPDQGTKLKGLEDAMKLQPAIGQAIGLGLLEGRPGLRQGIRGRLGAGMARYGAMQRFQAANGAALRRRGPIN